jgi:hypothetical protein
LDFSFSRWAIRIRRPEAGHGFEMAHQERSERNIPDPAQAGAAMNGWFVPAVQGQSSPKRTSSLRVSGAEVVGRREQMRLKSTDGFPSLSAGNGFRRPALGESRPTRVGADDSCCERTHEDS